MSSYQYYQSTLLPNSNQTTQPENNQGGNTPYIVILRGGLGELDPKSFMDRVVSDYLNNGLTHNDFVERTLDNPYVRVLIFGINELSYETKDK